MNTPSQHIDTPQQSLTQENLFNNNRFDDEIDLRELFLKLWQGKLYIIGSVCVFVLAAFFYTLYTKPTYQASAIISPPQKTGLEVVEIGSEFQVIQLIQSKNEGSQSELIDSSPYSREKAYSLFKRNLNSVNLQRTFILSHPTFTSQLAKFEHAGRTEALIQDWIDGFKIENIKSKLKKFQTSLDEMQVSFEDTLAQGALQQLFASYLRFCSRENPGRFVPRSLKLARTKIEPA